MRVLVVDTALGLCTAGVFEVQGADVRRLGLRSEQMAKGHSERLAGFARDAMAEAGLGFDAIDRIGVTVGAEVLAPHALERSLGKAKRISDRRHPSPPR